MNNIKTRNFISATVIIMMVASIFALPVINDDNSVNAATASSKKVKVKYNANSGTFTAKKNAKKTTVTRKVTKGKKVGTAPAIKKTGYTFKGWYTKKSKGKKVTKNTKVKKNQTLYARWEAKSYTITLVVDGDKVGTKSVKYGSKVGTISQIPKEDYEVSAWYTSPTGGTKVDANYVYNTTGNMTLYARWARDLTINPIFQNHIGKYYSSLSSEIGFAWTLDIDCSYTPGAEYKVAASSANGLWYYFKNDICVGYLGGLEDIFPAIERSNIPLSEFHVVFGDPLKVIEIPGDSICFEYRYDLGTFNAQFVGYDDYLSSNENHLIYNISHEEFIDIANSAYK